MKIYKFFRFVNTIKYLKFKQIYFRLFYYVRNTLRHWKGFSYSSSISSFATSLSLQVSIPASNILVGNEFTFLNLSQRFDDKVDWNFAVYGKLWTYNLNYFEYLNQEELSQEKSITVINDFITQVKSIKDGMEPYTISLRGMNWIKFLTFYQIKNQRIDDSLYLQYTILMDNLEYHLMGNHLLENAFSLLFGAYYFQDQRFYSIAKKLLITEMNEQILEDGAHFELSPMYHQIILFRLLDCVNLIQNNNWKNRELFDLMCSKSELMLSWLNTITFENGNIPLFNDSTNKIAPRTKELIDYAKRLYLWSNVNKHGLLTDSGYRKTKTKYYEMVADVGNIGPDYIPGHAHSDTFNFELYINDEPFIVDTGLSTYELNERRQLERSTCSHNTVKVNGENQSYIWGGFRVANRAKIVDIREKGDILKATHNGYKKWGVLHTRSFRYMEERIVIKDTLQGSNGYTCIAYLHFYPGINVTKEKNIIQCTNATIEFSGLTRIILGKYEYAPEFNSRENAIYAKIFFDNELNMQILVK